MNAQKEADGIYMFPEDKQVDIELGINRAIQVTGLPKGAYANAINQRFHELSTYLEVEYRTKSGQALGSSGRRELIKAFCLNDKQSFDKLLA